MQLIRFDQKLNQVLDKNQTNYIILILESLFFVGLFLLVGFFTHPTASASLEAENYVSKEKIAQFSQGSEPTFTLNTKEKLKSTSKNSTDGALVLNKGKISTELSYNGDKIEQKPEISVYDREEDRFAIRVKKTQAFRPGKYQLLVNVATDDRNEALTQDFTWGVLAINFNQSTYRESEKATIGMAVLDDHGITECTAKLKLSITSPNDQKTVLSTENNGVTVSTTCHNGNVTNEFDYVSHFIPETEGKYEAELEATTSNGTRTTKEFFEVTNNPDFVVRRLDTSMRIFPQSPYTVNLEAQALKSFSGNIYEKVPSSFSVSNVSADGVVNSKDDVKIISWPAKMSAGDRLALNYTYDAPDISPQFYLLGPLEFEQTTLDSDNGQTTPAIIFTESRAWQIATDATACSSLGSSGNWGTAGTWASPCNVSGGPTVNNDVTIINAAHTISVEASTTRAAYSITFTAGNKNTTLALTDSSAVLNVSAGVTINATSNGYTKQVTVGANALTAASISLAATTNSGRIAQVTLSTGTVTVSGSITSSGIGSNNVVFSSSGTINVGGDFTPSSLTCSTGKVNANGSSAQSLGAFTYYNLDINNTGNSSTYVSFAGNPTISGGLNITDGTIDFNSRTVGVTGASTIASAGTAYFSSSTGTKTFSGNVSVSGIWNENAAVAIAFGGNLTNNASTWTASTGTHTFSGSSKTINGSSTTTIPNLTINGTTGNSGTLVVSTTLAGSSTLTNNAGGTLKIGAASADLTITGLTASASTNTVEYNGTAGQTVEAITYSNLTISNASTDGVTFDGSTTVNNTLTDVTASSKLIFQASSTFTLAAINLNGQATGTRITMVSSTEGTHYHFNVSAASPSASYVNVRDSDASGGSQINATVGCYDSTGNTNWSFYYECVWTGASSNDWNTAGNWTSCNSTIPGTGSNATINLSSASSTVTTSSDISFRNLTIGGDTTYTNKLTLTNNITSGTDVTINSNGTLEQKNAWATALSISGSLTITGADASHKGTLTHADNSTSEAYRVNLSISGNLTVDANGQINVDGLGYDKLYGPGNGGTGECASASYGGEGGKSINGTGGTTYGSITTPVNLGSGGGYYGSSGTGGGAISLSVTGAATINGTVSSSGTGSFCSTGSGGSINLSGASISGSGSILAAGGSYSDSNVGQSGGGRIAVKLSSGTDFGSITIKAYGGSAASQVQKGAAGTVYLQKSTDTADHGELAVDNQSSSTLCQATYRTTLLNGSGSSSYQFARLNLTNAGILGIDSNDSLDISTTTITGDSDDRNEGIWLQDSATLTLASGALSWTNYFIRLGRSSSFSPSPSSITVGDKADLVLDQAYNISFAYTGNLTVLSGGQITHTVNYQPPYPNG